MNMPNSKTEFTIISTLNARRELGRHAQTEKYELSPLVAFDAREGLRVRNLANPDGNAIEERLQLINDKQHYYTYSIMKALFPVTIIYLQFTLKNILTVNQRWQSGLAV